MALEFVTLRFAPGQLEAGELFLGNIKNGMLRAVTNAINATVTQLKKIAADGLEGKTSLKRKYIKKRIYSRRFNPQNGTASLTVYGRRLSLTNFKHKDTRRKGSRSGQGVWVEIFKGGRVRFPNSFVAEGKFNASDNAGNSYLVGTGANQVFERRNLHDPKSALIARKGPKLFDIFKQTGVKATLESQANTLLAKNFKQKANDQIAKDIRKRSISTNVNQSTT